MKKAVLGFALAFLASALAAQPVVTSISPQTGPANGGTEVTISGSALLPRVNCFDPCPATVTFGEVLVTVTRETDTQLTVVTPAHLPGTVDVVVHVAGEEPIRLPAAFTFDGGAENAWESILLPIYFPGTIEGAFDSRWQADLWIRNNGNEVAYLAPWPCPPDEPCPPVFPLTYALQPGRHLRGLPPHFQPDTNPGQLLWVSRSVADDLAFGLRFADTARGSLNGGTDMPVVREEDLHLEPLHLLNVPMTHDYRVLLRLYETAYDDSTFRIVLYAYDASGVQRVLYQDEMGIANPQEGPFKTEAAYLQYDITRLLDTDDKAWPEAIHVEIVPLKAGSRFWAMASVTNNETQLVTLVTPQ